MNSAGQRVAEDPVTAPGVGTSVEGALTRGSGVRTAPSTSALASTPSGHVEQAAGVAFMEVGLRRYVVATNAGTVAVVLRALLGELLCLQPRGHPPDPGLYRPRRRASS